MPRRGSRCRPTTRRCGQAPRSGPRLGTRQPDEWIAAGQDFDLGTRTLTAITTPGHTRGHVVFADAAAGLLFAGDHVLPHITPSIGFEEAPSAACRCGDYLQSLNVVRRLPDMRLLPAHGPVSPSTHAGSTSWPSTTPSGCAAMADVLSGGEHHRLRGRARHPLDIPAAQAGRPRPDEPDARHRRDRVPPRPAGRPVGRRQPHRRRTASAATGSPRPATRRARRTGAMPCGRDQAIEPRTGTGRPGADGATCARCPVLQLARR